MSSKYSKVQKQSNVFPLFSSLPSYERFNPPFPTSYDSKTQSNTYGYGSPMIGPYYKF